MSRRSSTSGDRAVPAPPFRHPIPIGTRPRRDPVPFDLAPDAQEARAIARFLGIEDLRALRFRGALAPAGREDWRIEGRLSAVVVQRCVATLSPVEQRIDEAVVRDYVPEESYVEPAEIDVAAEDEDEPDPFGTAIDPGALALEALALALDPYPRAPGVPPTEYHAAPPGAEPLTDEAVKPFAGLAVLKEKLGDGKS